MKSRYKIILSAIFLFAVMAVIFVFSGQTGGASSNASNSVGEWALKIFGIEIPEGQTASTVKIFAGLTIRSLAHIFLFAVLGLASFLFVYALFGLKKQSGKLDVLFAALGAVGISLAYACVDELHQRFVSGRTAALRDVGYDAIGFAVTIIISATVTLLVNLKRKKSK